MPSDRPWSDTDRELVAQAIGDADAFSTCDCETCMSGRADAVLDALTAAGKFARSRYAGEGEARCGEPHPDGGAPCQMRPGHDTHARPASGGSDLWKRETDE